MRLALALIFVLGLGALVGLGATYWTVSSGFGANAVVLGPWRALADEGVPRPDPYTRAAVVRGNRIPLGRAEGLTFRATADDTGETLRPQCDYVIGGQAPRAAFWSLVAYDAQGLALPGDRRRHTVNSRNVLRGADGRFTIHLSAQPVGGNWIASVPDRSLSLALHLYQSAAGTGTAIEPLELPSITREVCR